MADEPQAIEGYACVCGYQTDDMKTFRTHLLQKGHLEPGVHKSQGRINMATGEKILPPWTERTPEERKMSVYAADAPKKGPTVASIKTENLGDATEIRFIPHVMTIPFSNILLCAHEAAVREKWVRPDIPIQNFIDTVFYNYFKEHGLVLQTYTKLSPGGNDGSDNLEEEEIGAQGGAS